jgi:hypothetical protein
MLSDLRWVNEGRNGRAGRAGSCVTSTARGIGTRSLVCGGPAMLADTRVLLERPGFDEGSMAHQGRYVIERAFVERRSALAFNWRRTR